MAHDKDNPLGVEIRGNERSMHFVHPYRRLGELNQVERWKLERHPLEVADAVISRYAKEGPDAIAEVAGEQERLKWVGLYPQRQGGDAFMMRVKVPGGVLTADQAREIGVVADAFGEGPDDSAVFGNRYADITTRQTSRSTGSGSATSPASGSASPMWGSPRSRRAGTRPATS